MSGWAWAAIAVAAWAVLAVLAWAFIYGATRGIPDPDEAYRRFVSGEDVDE